jgi:hypothetical protein
MLNETTHFLADLFQADRPLTQLVRADYTFANRALAKHYGLPGANKLSDEFRRIKSPHGGLAGMGLFLTQTALPLRTSPVQRGTWLHREVLGRRLPNPPGDVPAISQDETDGAGLSVRAQLQKHRANATCAACHDKIDPLGIALEGFDPIGRPRAKLRNGKAPVTATTQDGKHLTNAADLRDYLHAHRDEVLAHFTRKLLGYALGRPLQPGDTALLETLQTGLPKNDFHF